MYAGIDNDDSDKLKITDGGNPSSGNDLLVMTSNGVFDFPKQPGFLAINSATDTNQTGNGASPTVEFDSETFDKGTNYNNVTDTFTAPEDGLYRFTTSVVVGNLSSSMNTISTKLVTTAQRYELDRCDPYAQIDSTFSRYTSKGSILVEMTAGDTAYVTVQIAGGAGDTASIIGSGGVDQVTFFCGEKVS